MNNYSVLANRNSTYGVSNVGMLITILLCLSACKFEVVVHLITK